jgi:hypothetical protein
MLNALSAFESFVDLAQAGMLLLLLPRDERA